MKYGRSYSGTGALFYFDELIWAALWLHKATGKQEYLRKAEQIYDQKGLGYVYKWGASWENKVLGIHALLYDVTKKQKYKDLILQEIDFYLNQAKQTPDGFLHTTPWGTIASTGDILMALMQVIMHKGFPY